MTTTRIVKNLNSWAFIVKSNPDILKKHELNIRGLDEIPYDAFKQAMSALSLGKIKYPICINLSNYNKGKHRGAILRKEHFKLISEALITGKCPSDLKLNLHYSCINHDSENIEHLATALKSRKCPSGFILDLSNNYLHENLEEFSGALRHCPARFSLNLSECSLGDGDIALLFEEIINPKCQLQYLNLKRNNITADGALTILAALKHMSTPRYLKIDLSGNQIPEEMLVDIHCELEKQNAQKTCSIVQSEMDSKDSHLSKLPQEVANHIYQFITPLKNGRELKEFEKSIKNDVNNTNCCFIL